jgi:hypothetical protein
VGFPPDKEGGALVTANEALHPGLPVSMGQGSREEQVDAVTAVLQLERRRKQEGESFATQGSLAG